MVGSNIGNLTQAMTWWFETGDILVRFNIDVLSLLFNAYTFGSQSFLFPYFDENWLTRRIYNFLSTQG